jgi:TnpA family transposase
MTALDRTAYPRLGERLTREELDARYRLSEADQAFIRATARGDAGRLTLATLLKARQDLGCFPAPVEMHGDTVKHLAVQLGLTDPPALITEETGAKTLYRYRVAVRAHLNVVPYAEAGERLITATVLEVAATMSDPADLIGRVIEALGKAATDLPAFSTLDRLVNHQRAQVHARMYDRVTTRLTADEATALEALLIVQPGSVITAFNRLKQTPGPARPETIRLWTDRLDWLTGLLDPDRILEGIAHTKLRQFAAEATALEVSELLGMTRAGKRHTLLLSLLRQARSRCRDERIERLLHRIRRTQAVAKERLKALQDQHRAMEEARIAIFGQVLKTAKEGETDAEAGHRIRTLLTEQGGIDTLAERCETVSAWHSNNDLPLLWPIHAKTRSLLFRLLDLMDIRSATQDRSLPDALAVVVTHRHARRDDLAQEVDLRFASQRWRNFVVKRRSGRAVVDRRALEVCVFIHLAEALQAGDLHVIGAETFSDYRTQLLPWTACEPRLIDYCGALGMPHTAEAFIARLKDQLTETAGAVDAGFPANAELTLDAEGNPHLKQQQTRSPPEGLVAFEVEVHARLRERHLLDILKYGACWTRYTRHFGPPSGAAPKLAKAERRYILTVFGYGCNLGPGQTARHAPGIASAETLRRINAQHIDTSKIESATTDLINAYARFALPRLWGAGRAAIADGTHVPLRENNLIGAQHIRYGGYGGIAYHHIADSYIALFTSFIPCGVWEAIHILDGLMKNRSAIQPDTLHADTQGQSEPVFGLCRLLGITLMPRMRNWGDAIFYRPDKSGRYQHIDALFTKEIDWRLITTHWPDMMPVVLSIQAGLVLPSMLLRKLGSHNRKSRLCLAFRELGRVERTLFLLRYVSDPPTRRTIRAETTKIESFNDFLDWITFGGPVIKSGDPVEQEKQLKYASLVANAIMLSNVANLSEVLSSMAADGLSVTPELAASISPYTRKHIRRFGKYDIDMDDRPDPLEPTPLPFDLPL